jgi:two-component system, OmpR family, catabolic regulation response regulator CreB
MKPTVLIVEDEPAIADTIQYALETEGFATIRLTLGGPVIPLLDEESVDAIVLDVGLPDINGFELCKSIRRSRTVPILFLTARSEEVDRVVGLEIGGDDYITKPFSPRELTARVKAILRRSEWGSRAPFPAGPFTIDEGRRQITYYGAVVSLSRYEYAILRVLVTRPGQVFSREQIMHLCWDEPEMSLDRTVDAHIKNIRNKLKEVRDDLDPIVTHRGTGYSLREDL